MRIAIIGAGIGGLAAALACQNANIDFTLFDHAENPLSGGVALTLWPNALRALKEIGGFTTGEEGFHAIEIGCLRTDKDNQVYQLPLTWMEDTYGFKPVCVRRNELTTRLYRALQSPTIREAHCTFVSPTETGVIVQFSDGSREEFDGAIAADGIHSSIRHQLIGDSERTVDYTAWRGIAIDAEVPPASMCEYLGPGVRMGYAAINPSLTYWFATVNNNLVKPDIKWSTVVDKFSGFPKAVRSLIESTPEESILQNSIRDVLPGAPMAWSNVALLGDAAHAITPNLGLGGCLALEDAQFLGRSLRALQQGESLKQVFAHYAKSRRVRVARIANFTRWLGRATQMEQRSLMGLRNVAIGAVPSTIKKVVWRSVLGL
ncbi:FAD-dependent monooxygenase [Alicyclobacillus ferrooxydans]|uniref:FAD-dependent monooxygenase n=1 Tax=Alicyclobacillus ferrooxydans TaxID=471514 RepID=UPI0006D547BA|nr:FAD-dependent monooxygenase [Alicyclobacillus ferrooxydans]